MQQSGYGQINDDSHFFHCFQRTSFFERLARWSRFFCYGFLLFNLASILLQMIQPFAVFPPDLFYQMLFLLLVWGCIELIAIPLESIKDTCTLDYQKNWVIRAQHRFLFKRAIVVASFNQIKAIGVSCRPEPLSRLLFARSDKRYAIQMLDLNNQLISLSDFNLTLEEANEYVHNLYNRHLPGAQVIAGMPGFEIVYDHVTGILTSQPCRRTVLSIIDALCIPPFQALLAATGTSILLFAIIILLNTAAISIFSTNLQISHQPGFQLLASLKYPSSEPVKLQPPSGPPPQAPELPQEELWARLIRENETSSKTLTLNLFSESVVKDDFSITAATIAAILPADEAEKVTASDSNQPADIMPVNSLQTADPEVSHLRPAVTITEAVPTATIQIEPGTLNHQETTVQPEVSADPPQPIISQLEIPRPLIAPVLEPLNSRIPDVDPRLILKNTKPDKKSTAKFVAIIPDQTQNNAQQHISSDKAPSVTTIGAKPKPRAASVIKPGSGLVDFINLGQSIEAASIILGKPLAENLNANGRQVVFKDLTLKSNAENTNKITSIILTRKSTEHLGSMETPEKLSVGSMISDVTAHLGPAQLLANMPGLHYPDTGISFLPAAQNPEKVGAILIYASGTRPDEN